MINQHVKMKWRIKRIRSNDLILNFLDLSTPKINLEKVYSLVYWRRKQPAKVIISTIVKIKAYVIII